MSYAVHDDYGTPFHFFFLFFSFFPFLLLPYYFSLANIHKKNCIGFGWSPPPQLWYHDWNKDDSSTSTVGTLSPLPPLLDSLLGVLSPVLYSKHSFPIRYGWNLILFVSGIQSLARYADSYPGCNIFTHRLTNLLVVLPRYIKANSSRPLLLQWEMYYIKAPEPYCEQPGPKSGLDRAFWARSRM